MEDIKAKENISNIPPSRMVMVMMMRIINIMMVIMMLVRSKLYCSNTGSLEYA